MNAILLESALFVAVLAIAVALFAYVLGATPLGTRLRQSANRRRIDRAAELTCPVHGAQRAADMVRLPTGERLCPHCYREAVHGQVD